MNNKIIHTGAEVLEIDAHTGEILISSDAGEYEQLKQTKIKAFKLLSNSDFVMINGTWEAKRDGLIKILTSLPISYSWKLKDRVLTEKYAEIVGTLTVTNGAITRSADSMGICEFSELKGNGGMHFMNARAETRALKRAIETLFGSVINYYVINYLSSHQSA
mgnify:CR=1 FL=1|jgi:hypothetical protein